MFKTMVKRSLAVIAGAAAVLSLIHQLSPEWRHELSSTVAHFSFSVIRAGLATFFQMLADACS